MNYWLTLISVASGGAVGAVCRFQLSLWFHQWFGGQFPYATLTVNAVGSLLMGMLMSALNNKLLLSSYWHPLLAVGFLGALTTFSAFSMDTLLFINEGEWLKVGLNIFLNLLLCLCSVAIGYKLLTN